jgi:RHS repeat-associated protein
LPRDDPKTAGDPVILFTGQFYYQITDLTVPGRGLGFRLTRTYLHQTRYKGPLGYSWDHSYNLWLREEQEVSPDGSLQNVVYRSNGQVRDDRYVMITQEVLTPQDTLDAAPDAQFEGPPGFFDRLTKETGTYTLEMVSGVTVEYNADLQARRIEDANGNAVTLDYDANRFLIRVTDPVGKAFNFSYDELNRLIRVRDETGNREIRYTYGDNGDLVGADLAPDGELLAETDYDYLGPDYGGVFEHNLIGVTNALGHRVLDVEYGTDEQEWAYNRVIYQRSESGELEYDYQPVIDASDSPIDPDTDLQNFPRLAVLVRDRRGHSTEHRFSSLGTVVEKREEVVTAGLRQTARSLFRYNEDALLVEARFADGSGIWYRYGREAYASLNGGDSSDASPDDRLLFGLLLKEVQTPKAGVGEQRAIVTDYSYTPLRRLSTRRGPYYADRVTLIETAGQVVAPVTFFYDARGNLTEIQYPPATLPDGSLQAIPAQQFQYDGNGMLFESSIGSIKTRYTYFPDLLRSGFVQTRTEDAAAAALTTTFEIDAVGRTLSITSPYGAVEESTWNGFDLEVAHVRADPGTPRISTTFAYNRNRQLVGIVEEILDASGGALPDAPLVQSFELDAYGRITGFSSGPSADPTARQVRRVLAADGTVMREWDPRNVETKIIRDEVGQKTAVRYAPDTAEEVVQRYEYDVLGALTAIIDGNGGRTEFEYDSFGRIRVTRDPDRNEVRRTFDAAGRVLSQELHGQHPETGIFVRWAQTEFEYDVLGRTIATRRHLFVPGDVAPDRLLATLTTYDAYGRVSVSEDPGGNKTTAQYDGLGRMTQLVSPDGHVTSWSIDDIAHTVTSTTNYVGKDALGNVTHHIVRNTVALDRRGLPISYEDALGNATSVGYDSRDLEVFRVDAAGVRTNVVRNVFGEVVSRTEDVGGKATQTQYQYDNNGNLTFLTDPIGQTTGWEYDSLSRLIRTRRGASSLTREYDLAGFEKKRTLEDGVVCVRTLSPGGRVMRETVDLTSFVPPAAYPGYVPAVSSDATFAYSPAEELSRATNADYDTVIRHDSLGRMLSEATNGTTSTCTYDDLGNRLDLAYPHGRQLSASWSAEGHLVSLAQTGPGAAYPGDPAAPPARPLADIYRVGKAVTRAVIAGTRVEAFYDRGRRAVGLDWTDMASGNAIHRERRLYSSRGDCRLEQLNGRRRVLQTDTLLRLASASDTAGNAVIDVSSLRPPSSVANLTATGQSDEDLIAGAGAAAAAWSIAYDLDDNGNRRSVTEPGSPAVPYQLDSFDSYSSVGADVWINDGAGRVLRAGAIDFRHDSRGRLERATRGPQQSAFRYDALGRLRAITRGGVTQELHYFSEQLLEVTRAGVLSALFAYAERRLCQVAVDGQDYVPLTDLTGSVLGWIDGAGATAAYRVYDPFGRILQEQGVWLLPIGFRGYWFDDISGVALLLARSYWPEHGRFLERDPAGLIDGTNAYAFASNSPLLWSDIWGFNSTELDWGTVATSAATTAAVGIGMGVLAGAAVAAGIVSAPFLLVAGAVLLVGAGVNAYLKRADQALQAGETDFSGRAALAAAGDAVGVTGIYEGITGRDVVTHRQFGGQERSEKLGQGLGSAAALVAGGRSYKFGTSLGKQAISAGYINPYTVVSASRPSFYNPIVFGKYTTPNGLVLEGNMISGVRAGFAKFVRTGSAADAYAATLENSRGFSHILRHFSDNPGRVNANGNPQAHGVFLPEYRGRVVELLDNAFELATNPQQQVAYVEAQGARTAVTVFSQGGPGFGTALGNPAAVPRPTQYPYGAAVDVYTTIFNATGDAPVTMYPGFPVR